MYPARIKAAMHTLKSISIYNTYVAFNTQVSASAYENDAAPDVIWSTLKNALIQTSDKICGKTKPHRWRKETWWWTDEVEDLIVAKRQAFKAWKSGKGTRATYNTAKRAARQAVHHARYEADKE